MHKRNCVKRGALVLAVWRSTKTGVDFYRVEQKTFGGRFACGPVWVLVDGLLRTCER